MTAEEKQKQDEQKAALLQNIEDKVKSTLESRGVVNMDGVRGAITEALTGLDLEGLRSYSQTAESVRQLAEKIEKLESTGLKEDKIPSIREQIQKWMTDNKTAIEGVRAGGSAPSLPVLHLRAPATMMVSTSLNASAYLPNVQVDPTVIDLVRIQPTFWDGLTKGRTAANPFVWVNKVNKEGNAQFIGEGVLKPLASFQLETESSVPKKVAERMKASTELLYDVPGMESLIRDELAYEVKMAANTAVLTGTVSATSPAGVTTLASAYTLTTVKTTNPNNFDAIRAAVAQLRSLNFNGTITAYVNPIDAANMDLTKAVDSGVYMLPPFTTPDGTRIAGVRIIEDNNIAVGYLLIGDFSYYKIKMYQDFFVSWGWENDDFSRNLVTVIGEMRFHQYMSSNHAGAFIYDTFANIKTAITTA